MDINTSKKKKKLRGSKSKSKEKLLKKYMNVKLSSEK